MKQVKLLDNVHTMLEAIVESEKNAATWALTGNRLLMNWLWLNIKR